MKILILLLNDYQFTVINNRLKFFHRLNIGSKTRLNTFCHEDFGGASCLLEYFFYFSKFPVGQNNKKTFVTLLCKFWTIVYRLGNTITNFNTNIDFRKCGPFTRVVFLT